MLKLIPFQVPTFQLISNRRGEGRGWEGAIGLGEEERAGLPVILKESPLENDQLNSVKFRPPPSSLFNKAKIFDIN